MNEEITHDKALIGAAGVHFVCAELSRRGIIALPTIRNTPGIDISAVTPKKHLPIQVKTARDAYRWPVPKEEKIPTDEDYCFIFVNLKGNLEGRPDYFMLPGKFLKEHMTKAVQSWFATPGKGGRMHNKDNPLRLFVINEKEMDQWDKFKMDKVLQKILEE